MQSVLTFSAERCVCEKVPSKPVPPPPTQHYLSMEHSLSRPGGLGKIYIQMGSGCLCGKRQLPRPAEICSIESPGALGLKCQLKIKGTLLKY